MAKGLEVSEFKLQWNTFTFGLISLGNLLPPLRQLWVK